jgi:hypothetical protein
MGGQGEGEGEGKQGAALAGGGPRVRWATLAHCRAGAGLIVQFIMGVCMRFPAQTPMVGPKAGGHVKGVCGAGAQCIMARHARQGPVAHAMP